MSYEPTLIISKEDLHKHEEEIENWLNQKRPKKPSEKWKRENEAYYQLMECLTHEGQKIRGIEIILIKPEISRHNAEVRKLLHHFNIEFAADN